VAQHNRVHMVLPAYSEPTCPLDAILLDFLTSSRESLRRKLPLDVVLGPEKQTVKALFNPELTEFVPPLSAIMTGVLSTFRHVAMTERLAFFYVMCLTTRVSIHQTVLGNDLSFRDGHQLTATCRVVESVSHKETLRCDANLAPAHCHTGHSAARPVDRQHSLVCWKAPLSRQHTKPTSISPLTRLAWTQAGRSRLADRGPGSVSVLDFFQLLLAERSPELAI
jgi:hypothetical protein